MCDCRKEFEAKAAEHYREIEDGKATLQGYMLIPSGFQYLECEVVGARTTAKGKIVKQKKVINALGKFCMFCGEAFKERAF
jgi:hypothetical protein